jgi:hypothetical protein
VVVVVAEQLVALEVLAELVVEVTAATVLVLLALLELQILVVEAVAQDHKDLLLRYWAVQAAVV